MERVVKVVSSTGLVSEIAIGAVETSLARLLPETRVIAIADASIHRCYGRLLDRFDHIIIGQGESNKTLSTLETIYRELLALNADRRTFILGIGGGIVTDITGFAASTYMRGLDFGFISTTLLSQVDAGVGGKNGVNLDGFKNIVGTFNQPRFVICDPSMLHTLPRREMRAGMAEIIKSAVIADPVLFEMLEGCEPDQLFDRTELLGEVIGRAIEVKAAIVGRDERENGERRKLNLGHTVAHAIEKCSNHYIHGEAVAIGLVAVGRMALSRGLIAESDQRRIESLCVRYGLPTECDIDPKRLASAIRHDKKCDGDTINIVYPVAIGQCVVERCPIDSFVDCRLPVDR